MFALKIQGEIDMTLGEPEHLSFQRLGRLCLLGATACMLHAQSRVTVQGRILDETRAPIAGARILAT